MDIRLFCVLCSLLLLSRADLPPKEIYDDEQPEVFQYFVTRPDIQAPKWIIETYDEDAVQKGLYWFIAPYNQLDWYKFPEWNGPYIYRTDGVLIWSGAPTFGYENVHDFHPSYIDGRPVLTFIRQFRDDTEGWVYDNTYTPAHNVPNPIAVDDMHEFHVVEGGTRALMVTRVNFTRTSIDVGDQQGKCTHGWQGFREIDIHTGEIVFDWEAYGHVTLEEFANNKSVAERCERKWELAHMNAVDKFADGDYLLSMRNADTILKIDHRDGSIVWRLGGIHSDFVLGDGVIFQEQHFARVQGQNDTHTLISLFNNAPHGKELNVTKSWALLLALRTDVFPMTAEVVRHYGKPTSNHDFAGRSYTITRGSVDFLPNGNVFIGWVEKSEISEHTVDGRLVQLAALTKRSANTYRSYKLPWIGLPAQPPHVVSNVTMEDYKLYTIVYVSWNGATEVASWNILHTTESGDSSQLVASAPMYDFETRIAIPGYAEHVVAVGMDEHGKELGRSQITKAIVSPTLDETVVGGLETKWLKTHTGALWSATASSISSHWIWFWVSAVLTVIIVTVVTFMSRKKLLPRITKRSKYEDAADYEIDVLMDHTESAKGQSKWARDSTDSDGGNDADDDDHPPRYHDEPTPEPEVPRTPSSNG